MSLCVLLWYSPRNEDISVGRRPRRNLKRHRCKPIWRPHHWASICMQMMRGIRSDRARRDWPKVKFSTTRAPNSIHPPTWLINRGSQTKLRAIGRNLLSLCSCFKNLFNLVFIAFQSLQICVYIGANNFNSMNFDSESTQNQGFAMFPMQGLLTIIVKRKWSVIFSCYSYYFLTLLGRKKWVNALKKRMVHLAFRQSTFIFVFISPKIKHRAICSPIFRF